jgi:hypothetical protein
MGPEESERLRTMAPDMAPRRSSPTRSTVPQDARTACRISVQVWPGKPCIWAGPATDVPAAGLMAARSCCPLCARASLIHITVSDQDPWGGRARSRRYGCQALSRVTATVPHPSGHSVAPVPPRGDLNPRPLGYEMTEPCPGRPVHGRQYRSAQDRALPCPSHAAVSDGFCGVSLASALA